MKEDIIEAIRKCETTFLPQYNRVVKASLTPYQDNKEDEEGYSLNMEVFNGEDNSWYLTDMNHRVNTTGMTSNQIVENIQNQVISRMKTVSAE